MFNRSRRLLADNVALTKQNDELNRLLSEARLDRDKAREERDQYQAQVTELAYKVDELQTKVNARPKTPAKPRAKKPAN